jgi:hypothetical protein
MPPEQGCGIILMGANSPKNLEKDRRQERGNRFRSERSVAKRYSPKMVGLLEAEGLATRKGSLIRLISFQIA